jgi:hypothetical protein
MFLDVAAMEYIYNIHTGFLASGETQKLTVPYLCSFERAIDHETIGFIIRVHYMMSNWGDPLGPHCPGKQRPVDTLVIDAVTGTPKCLVEPIQTR